MLELIIQIEEGVATATLANSETGEELAKDDGDVSQYDPDTQWLVAVLLGIKISQKHKIQPIRVPLSNQKVLDDIVFENFTGSDEYKRAGGILLQNSQNFSLVFTPS